MELSTGATFESYSWYFYRSLHELVFESVSPFDHAHPTPRREGGVPGQASLSVQPELVRPVKKKAELL